MDEMQEIRKLLGEPAPPSGAVVTAARVRLTSLTDAPPAARSPWVRRRVLLTGIAATAATAAVAVTVLWPANGRSVVDPAREQQARDVLLVAAERAEDDAAGTGRFWRLRTLETWTGSPLFLFGGSSANPVDDDYALELRKVDEYWLARDESEADWVGERNLGVRPATPEDEQAWRRAGAPTEWGAAATGEGTTRNGGESGGGESGGGESGGGESGGGNAAESGGAGGLSATPDGGSIERLPPAEWSPVAGMTMAELRDLPTDVAALRDALVGRRLDPSPDEQRYRLLSTATGLLTAPVSAQVRASAFRLLADLGGVRSTGPATDPIGREGIGLSATVGSASLTEFTIVIDPRTGQLLSQTSRAGDLDGAAEVPDGDRDRVTLSAEWTDAEPTVPGTDVP